MSAYSVMIQNKHKIHSMCRHLQCTSCIAAIAFVLDSVEFKRKCQIRLHPFAILVSMGHRVMQNW